MLFSVSRLYAPLVSHAMALNCEALVELLDAMQLIALFAWQHTEAPLEEVTTAHCFLQLFHASLSLSLSLSLCLPF